MTDSGVKANWSRLPISIIISFAVAFAAWFPMGYCPGSMAGIEALKSTWFWVGQACENYNYGFAALGYLFASILLFALQSLLTFAIFSPMNAATSSARKYISVIAIALVFFLIYLLLFAL